MGDILEQKGYYDALVTSFEQINAKREVKHHEVIELEKEQKALTKAIEDLTRRLKDLEGGLADKAAERDSCTGFIDDLEAGGPRAKAAMLRLARTSMTIEERAAALREDLLTSLLAEGEPTSPKVGSSSKMHNEAVQTQDLMAQLPNGKGLAIRCYSGADPGSPTAMTMGMPVVVYFHGEGYTAGDLSTHDWLCRSFAALSRLTVVAVDYRRAPEDRFPAAFDDAYASLRWVAGGGLGTVPRRLAVAGDCAGGGLAAACCLHARDDPHGPTVSLQILFYPWLDLRPDAPSLSAESDDGGLFQDSLFWYRHLYTPLVPADYPTVASVAGSKPPSLASLPQPSGQSTMSNSGVSGAHSALGSKPPTVAPTQSQAASMSGSKPASARVPPGSKPPSLPASKPPSARVLPASSKAASSRAGCDMLNEEAREEVEEAGEEKEVQWFMDPRASPMLAPSLSGLPRAFIAYAEDDPLAGDAVAFAERLSDEGGGPEAVHTLFMPGPLGHGFVKFQHSPEARSAISAAAAFASASLRN